MAGRRDIAEKARAWPFEEARRVEKRIGTETPAKGYVLFETGYGPSGLPHIGTFAEVARTNMVRRAFAELSDVPTKLFAFSDDMDGLRRVPDNVPNREMVAEHLGKPLTRIPDPFGTHESFGHHNNARLREFLDAFGFDYEFQSATDVYRSGRFDAALLRVLECYDEVTDIILPTLGEERQRTYSPFLPISPSTGEVLQVPILERKLDAGTIVFRDPADDRMIEVPVTGGHCKLQWKADWAMRWYALDVDYEMSGKDLIDSVRLSGRICRALGGRPPEGFTYELFLDDKGEKISKSRGNGLAVEEWLKYAPPESLSLFMFQKPRAAKKLYFDVIPKAVDEYRTFLARAAEQDDAERFENPAWHIHDDELPEVRAGSELSYAMLLNLAGVANAERPAQLWAFVSRYQPDLEPGTAPLLDRLVGHAIAYYRDFVAPAKRYRLPDAQEAEALRDLDARLAELEGASAEDLQTAVYEVGKAHGFENLRDWFRALYEVLLGQSQGPRMGSFIAIYGVAETRALIARVLAGESLGAA